MPRNYDEAVEWPDEVAPDLDDLIRLLELSEELHDSDLLTDLEQED